MTRDFYEFLFQLRGSGFMRHTPENTEKLLYLSRKNILGDFKLESAIDGEVGSLSDNAIRNMQNILVCVSSQLGYMAMENNASLDYALGLSDYYINMAEKIRTYEHFQRSFSEMCHQFKELMETKQVQSYGHLIDSCIHYIEQKLYEPLTAQMVAEHARLSSSYLSGLFRQKTGRSLYQFITQRKIEESKDMIRNTNQPLSTIASALGYNSLSHLSKAFKAAVGVSPIAYRNR